ncbi:MAG: bifunctional pyr operon transcriptional regulator/uracil phosphoribosyltransferase, partial [Clostridia bacterium]
MHQKAQIMDENAIRRALMRLSHEIVEKNKGAKNLVFVGIRRRGEPLSRLLRDNILGIEGISVPCGSID